MASVNDTWWRFDKITGQKVKTARHGRGKRWRVTWYDDAGRQRTEAFTKKSDADGYRVEVEGNLQRGTYIDPAAGNVTLRAYGEQRWFPAQVHLRPNTVRQYQAHLRNHIYPAFGDRKIGSLRRADMKNFVAAISSRLAPATVETVYAILRALMQSAVDDGVIPANPCSRVRLPRVDARVVEPMPVASVLALAEAMTPRYRLAVMLGAGAGLREGETLGLTASRVDFLRRRVCYVEEQMQNGVLSPLKTDASRRTVPLDDGVLADITRHMQRYEPCDEHGVLVLNRCGGHVNRSSFGHCWRDAVERAGLPVGTRFHDLRHFYASTLIAAGLHPKAIQVRLGHATIAETMDTYGHLFPDSEELGRGALDAVLRADVYPMTTRQQA